MNFLAQTGEMEEEKKTPNNFRTELTNFNRKYFPNKETKHQT
jgi:hypothetical protein